MSQSCKEKCHIIEDFYGVYLLYCINPKYKGRTYIGYTRDPTRRIKQHNRGTWAGGAWKTSNRGPWKMVMIVHGFPNNISALRFEWAWQNPSKTIRLRHVTNLKKIPRKETQFKFNLRILSEMLRVGPWCRLPLTIQWLERDYYEDFPVDKALPIHMPVSHGPVKSKNKQKKCTKQMNLIETHNECSLCSKPINGCHSELSCLSSNCNLIFHIICLANTFMVPGEYIPIGGECPGCRTYLKWGDMIRKMNGYSIGNVLEDVTDDLSADSDNDVCSQDNEENGVVGVDGLSNYDDDDL